MILILKLLVACLFSETFFKALTDNVEKYKQIHFEWNIKNMDSDKFQSLWAIEAEMEPDINLDEMRYDDNVRLKKEAKIDSLAQTMQYGGKCGVACLGKRDSDKGSNDKDIPRPMMYSNKKQYFVKSRSEEDVHPHGMMYSDKRHNLNVGGENVGLPRTMRYSGKKQKLMMNVPRMADTTHDQHPQNMMYIDESSDASIAPRAMMTTIIDETLSQTSQTAISDGHQDIIEEIKPSVTAEPIIIKREKEDAYSGEFGQKRFKNEGHPRTMRYANKKKQQMMTNFQEITDTKNDQHPQNTMYIDESSDAGRVPRAMMTYVDVDVKSSQTAISDGHQDIIEEIKPSVTAEPIIIKREKEDAYSGEFGQKRYKNEGHPRTMRYANKKKQQMMTNFQEIIDTTNDQYPQNMMYIDESSDAGRVPRAMMTYVDVDVKSSQTAISDGHQDIIGEIKPSVTAEPIIIKREKEDAYSGEFGQKRYKNEGHPRTMRYVNKKKQQMMTNFQEITDTTNDQYPQNMMYIDESSDAGRVPRAMMTYVDVDVKSSQTAISDGHQDIIEEIKPSVTAEPIIIKREKEDAYSGEFGQKRYKNEGHPPTMRYANKKKQQMMTNFQEIIDTTNDQYPQNMMYIDESSYAGRVPRAMMTYVDVDVKSSQTAISDGHQDIIEEIKHSVTAEPIIIKREKEDAYSGEFGQKSSKNEGHPRTMRYANKKKQQMMTNFQEIIDTTNDQYPQNMMYIDESSDAGRAPRAMMTTVDEMSSQTAISDGHQEIIEEIKPVPVPAETIIIKREKEESEDVYSRGISQKRSKNVGHPRTMRYSGKKKQQMMTNFEVMVPTGILGQPKDKIDDNMISANRRSPRTMKNTEISQQGMNTKYT